MTFLWMDMLWLLLLLPLMVAAYLYLLRRKKKTALRYANLAMVKQAMGNVAAWRRHVPPALFLTGMALMILAIARPAAIITLASQRATVLLTMDVSGSMRATDAEPTRIAAAQVAAKEFIKNQPRDVRIGIVAFAGTAFLVQPPTTNRDDLNAAINRFELQRGTAVGSGILVALQTIFPDEDINLGPNAGPFGRDAFPGASPLGQDATETKKPPKPPVPPGSYPSAVIVLLTDGQTTTGPDPVEAARLAADHGVRVFTVGFGTSGGNVVAFGGRSMRAQLDETALKQVSDMTRASYYHATTSAELKKIYQVLNTQLIKERKETEITAFFSAAAAAVMLLAGLLSMLWFNRVL